MFERTRSNLTERLGTLMDRFDAIERRALDHADNSRFALRAGMSDGGNIPLFDEIAIKSREQGDLCGQAIHGLLVDRALPLIFKRSVSKAERFAEECERILDGIDLAQKVAKRTFSSRYGISD